MKLFVKIFIKRFDELTAHRQLYHEIIINIERSSRTIHVLNKIS